MFRRLRLLTAGESHGPGMSAILEGFPAGLSLDFEALQYELSRRQKGFGSGKRMRIEKDSVSISAGYVGGRTTGGPLHLVVVNKDFKNWADRDVAPMNRPRPGHADLTGALKYGHPDLRFSLERASARETVMRVAAGAICKQLLGQFGIQIVGYVRQLGETILPLSLGRQASTYLQRAQIALGNDLCCPSEVDVAALRATIRLAVKEKDTLGGVFEVVGLGLPPGLGSYVHFDRRLDGRLAQAMICIPAMKGMEIGPAFENAGRRGTQVHDAISLEADGRIGRVGNRAGGLEGGVSTGMPLVVRVAMKPISTTLRPRPTVDLSTGEVAETEYERSDFCALPRAVPIGESMMALLLCDVLLEKLGGDSLSELQPRFEALRSARLEDLKVDGKAWRFDYHV